MRQYTHVISRSTLAPHIFAISDAAFSSLCFDNENQCCIVSGESGAGEWCCAACIVLSNNNSRFLAHHIGIISSIGLSLCLSVTLCIVALRVGVQG